MVISPPTNGVIMVILGETDKFIPEKFNNEKVVIFRKDSSTNNELKMVKDLGQLADPSLVKPPDEPFCNYAGDGNPLHQHTDESWWFYEETWALENGPFTTYEDAYNALETYCIVLQVQKDSEIKDLTEEPKDESMETDGVQAHPEGVSDASSDGPSER